MESSTKRTFLLLNSISIGFNFCFTVRFLRLCPGIMKVLPMYRFFIKPSLYFTPSLYATCIAAVLLVSGIGITTSMSNLLYSFLTFSPRKSPIRSLVLCTEIESIFESGREKYTNSNKQGRCSLPLVIHLLNNSPLSLIIMA